jgi:myo-inositol 2-dehydrogenase/D-chiro-inositol 1-dehydrogenase
MSSSRLGVGIIGAGQAAQALHIPALNSLADDFRIEACCDHDQGMAERVAASVGARAYTDPRALCADARVDVVLISAPDAVHMQMVEVACKAKKKAVVIEKPATLHARLAREMTRRAEATGVPVIVNYPHVYDYAFEAAQRAWGDRPLSYGQFRSVLGMNPLYTEDEILQTIRPQRPSWFLGVVNQMQYATATVELIGLEVPPHLYVGYILLIGVMIHDIPIMRRLVGEPVSVEHASMRALTNPVDASGQCIDSILNVGRGRVLMQTELGPMRHTDWSFELRGDDLHVKVRFPNAFGGTSESECRLLRDAGGTTSEEIISGRYENGFRRMWLHARDVVRADVVVRTPLDDAVKDLEVCEAIVKAAAENWRRGPLLDMTRPATEYADTWKERGR